MYVENLPSLTARFQKQIGEQIVEEAWWMLVLGGIGWRMSIYISQPEPAIPSRLYYDQTPVYIGYTVLHNYVPL